MSLRLSLSNWAERQPGQTLEFMADPDVDLLAETLVSFANSDGGTIVVGADPSGRIQGGLTVEDVQDVLRLALAQGRPVVRTEWQQSAIEDGAVVVIHVPRSSELHSLEDGRVLVRSGLQNRPLGGNQILHLAATKSSGDFEVEEVPEASLDDLDKNLIAEYRTNRAERQRRPIAGDDVSMLVNAGALTESRTPTVLGVLLFARNPQDFLPQCKLIFVRFAGTEMRGPGGLPGYARREEIAGPLPRLIEEAWQVMWEEMRVAAVVKGLVREEKAEYPSFAVREALVNAVCHRDYRLSGRHIEIRMFDDRLEVLSPGGLPGYITVDNIVEEHFSRNPRLVNGLFQWGFIEELGLGIDRMIEDMVNAGHSAPEFRDTSYSFTVTLRNTRVRRPVMAWESNMNERQLQALSFVQERGRITNRDYRVLCPDVSAETLRLDLSDLVDRGFLLKIGAKKGTYYILKKSAPEV